MVARLLKTIKKSLLKLTPRRILLWYHQLLGQMVGIWASNPSQKMLIIGITGTKGKTSTGNFLHQILEAGGHQVGLISTANIKIGGVEKLNPYHMTMPGRGRLHLLMQTIYQAGCQICIVEVTSEGLKQKRHSGIWFDVAIFTNLTPEHLPSHNNSFEDYKLAKLELMTAIQNRRSKTLANHYQPRVIVANFDSPHYSDFTNFKVDQIVSYGSQAGVDVMGQLIEIDDKGLDFTVNGENYHSPIPGAFNLPNILAAVATAKSLGESNETIRNGISNTKIIPGRMEEIKNDLGFKVFIDYAHEKESMRGVLESGRKLTKNNGKVILILGAEGGGRDKQKRADMGKLANQFADFSIITNVDPYDDDPEEIANDIAQHFEHENKVKIILDRRKAIREALKTAKPDDIILVTGKGAEQSMIIGTIKTAWDDRIVTKEELAKLT